jgi:hypothetical protein
MLNKRRLFKHLEDFPEEFTFDQLVERLIFIENLEERIKESEQGLSVPKEKAEAEIKGWF